MRFDTEGGASLRWCANDYWQILPILMVAYRRDKDFAGTQRTLRITAMWLKLEWEFSLYLAS